MFVTAPKELSPARQIATGDTVNAGQTVEVPDEVGASLVEQGWSEATKTAAKKAAKTEADSPADDPAPDGADPKES